MFTVGLSAHSARNLELLGRTEWMHPFYLAGGTAASLHLGHRFSFDLDFFTPDEFDVRIVRDQVAGLGSLSVEHEGQETFLGTLNGEHLSFFRYRYPLLFDTADFHGVRIADLRDIACMKIDAISSRGIKRDFIDLFFIAKQIPLDELLELFKKKYSGVDFSVPHLLRSLGYFEDAEASEAPRMLQIIDWDDVKCFFSDETIRIGKARFV